MFFNLLTLYFIFYSGENCGNSHQHDFEVKLQIGVLSELVKYTLEHILDACRCCAKSSRSILLIWSLKTISCELCGLPCFSILLQCVRYPIFPAKYLRLSMVNHNMLVIFTFSSNERMHKYPPDSINLSLYNVPQKFWYKENNKRISLTLIEENTVTLIVTALFSSI